MTCSAINMAAHVFLLYVAMDCAEYVPVSDIAGSQASFGGACILISKEWVMASKQDERGYLGDMHGVAVPEGQERRKMV